MSSAPKADKTGKKAKAPMGRKPAASGAGAMPPAPASPKLGWETLLLAVLAVGLGVALFMEAGSAPLAPAPGAPNLTAPGANSSAPAGEDLLKSPNAAALLGAFDKLDTLPLSYRMAFQERIDAIPTDVVLRRSGEMRQATMTSAFHTRQFSWSPNGTVLCEQDTGANPICGPVANDSPMAALGARLRSLFPEKGAADQKDQDARLIQMGAILFRAPPQESTVMGRPCTQVQYTLDYRRLDEGQLAALGKKPTDADVAIFTDFRLEKCIDRQYGVALSSRLRYSFRNITLEDQRTYTALEAPAPGFEMPPATVDAARIGQEYQKTNAFAGVVSGCASEDAAAQDLCLLRAALGAEGEVRYCALPANPEVRDECHFKLGVLLQRPEYCGSAGALADECYTNVAFEKGDLSYCSLVKDAAARARCQEGPGAARPEATEGDAGTQTPSTTEAPEAGAPGAGGAPAGPSIDPATGAVRPSG